MFSTMKLKWLRWRYLRKLVFIDDCRRQGWHVPIEVQLDAIELLQKINVLGARVP